MKCPQCNYEQVCPCKHCKDRTKGLKPWIWLPHDVIKCVNCGLAHHCDWWLTEEMKAREEGKGKTDEH